MRQGHRSLALRLRLQQVSDRASSAGPETQIHGARDPSWPEGASLQHSTSGFGRSRLTSSSRPASGETGPGCVTVARKPCKSAAGIWQSPPYCDMPCVLQNCRSCTLTIWRPLAYFGHASLKGKHHSLEFALRTLPSRKTLVVAKHARVSVASQLARPTH